MSTISNLDVLLVDEIQNKANDGPPTIAGLSAVAWDGVDWDVLSVSTTDLSLDIQLTDGDDDYQAETALVLFNINQADGGFASLFITPSVGTAGAINNEMWFIKTSSTGRFAATLIHGGSGSISAKIGIMLPSGELLQSAQVDGWETSD